MEKIGTMFYNINNKSSIDTYNLRKGYIYVFIKYIVSKGGLELQEDAWLRLWKWQWKEDLKKNPEQKE